MRWAGDEPELQRQAAKALGRALWESTKAEGIATERDRAKIREAAALLVVGDDQLSAGEALEAIGDLPGAAQAYSAGGFVERMEQALAKEDAVHDRERDEADAFAASYEMFMRVGRRDDARAELARAIASAAQAGDYRRLIDQLDTSLLDRRPRRAASGAASRSSSLVPRRRSCSAATPLCDLSLRAGGVVAPARRDRARTARGRSSSAISTRATARRSPGCRSSARCRSRATAVRPRRRVLDRASTEHDALLVLRVTNGLDRGVALIAGDDGARVPLAPVGLPASTSMFQHAARCSVAARARRRVQWRATRRYCASSSIRGDRIVADGDEIDIG